MKRFFSPSRLVALLPVLALFALGLALRLYDLTDEPLDFHPTRQLRSAIIARGMYYDMLPGADPALRDQAVTFWRSATEYEPPIFERVVAAAYMLAGGERVWIARLLSSLFWIAGGIALYALARRMVSGEAGPALVALGYYLLLPLGVQASRSFQPDPGMVMWLLLFAYALYRWSEQPRWKWAVLAGLFAGLAVLTKVVAAYLVAGAAVALVLYTLGLRRTLRNPQVWAMAGLMVVPSAFYYLVQNDQFGGFFANRFIALSHLLIDPSFYMRWLSFVQDLVGFTVILLGLVGVLIAAPRPRALLLGLWAGYLLYGMFFPYRIYTHNYYHQQFIPILGLSLVPVAQALFDRLSRQRWLWRAGIVGVALLAAGYTSWIAVLPQYAESYAHEPSFWRTVGELLPADGRTLALTQDYGLRLQYYGWRKVELWPSQGDQNLSELRGGSSKSFEEAFADRAEGMNYFLITSFNQLNQQKDLRDHLEENYPILAEGGGYRIYDLTRPLVQSGQ